MFSAFSMDMRHKRTFSVCISIAEIIINSDKCFHATFKVFEYIPHNAVTVLSEV